MQIEIKSFVQESICVTSIKNKKNALFANLLKAMHEN